MAASRLREARQADDGKILQAVNTENIPGSSEEQALPAALQGRAGRTP